MSDSGPLIRIHRLEALETSQWRLRWGMGMLTCLWIALTLVVASRPAGVLSSSAVRLAEASSAGILTDKEGMIPAMLDRFYDEFLREFKRLRRDGQRRRYLIEQVLAAAALHHLDPDLLFALIAIESGFDSAATSPKGALGLGQLMFSTAQAAAPQAIRQPDDLYDIPRNLYATARHLQGLLDEVGGDVRIALRAYHRGLSYLQQQASDPDVYVARVSTQYAYLKVRRMRELLSFALARQADVDTK